MEIKNMVKEAIISGVIGNLAYKGLETVVKELNIPLFSPNVFNEIQKAHGETLDKWAKNEGARSKAWLKVSRLIKDNYAALLKENEFRKNYRNI